MLNVIAMAQKAFPYSHSKILNYCFDVSAEMALMNVVISCLSSEIEVGLFMDQ